MNRETYFLNVFLFISTQSREDDEQKKLQTLKLLLLCCFSFDSRCSSFEFLINSEKLIIWLFQMFWNYFWDSTWRLKVYLARVEEMTLNFRSFIRYEREIVSILFSFSVFCHIAQQQRVMHSIKINQTQLKSYKIQLWIYLLTATLCAHEQMTMKSPSNIKNHKLLNYRCWCCGCRAKNFSLTHTFPSSSSYVLM